MLKFTVIQNFFLLYVIVMPLTSAFAITEWTPLPLLMMVLLSPYALIKHSNVNLFYILGRDWLFGAVFFLGVLAILFAPSYANGVKNLNYSFAVFACYFFYFYIARILILDKKLDWQQIGSACQVSLGLLSIFVIFEFILASFYGAFLSDYIHYAHKDLPIADWINSNYKRPRGFTQEPGFTAMAFECLWPIAFLARRARYWLHILYLVAFLMLASAASVICIVVSIFIVWIANGGLRRLNIIYIFLSIILMFIFYISEGIREIFYMVIGRKLEVFAVFDGAIDNDFSSLADRINVYQNGFRLLVDNPFGLGWGGAAQIYTDQIVLYEIGRLTGSGLMSMVLDIAVATGFLGLTLWLIFFLLRIYNLRKISNFTGNVIVCSLVSVYMHHFLITEFQLPFLWFSFALADKLICEKRFN